ncbi:MAG: hypothetical protein CMF62_02285 [Magnetococcales bacterium]|nr:hypothetical protein [Magnetococcales bacterium]|tara:strand:+ start:430 stop:810 length:381 start_codon:yes stop_codon:yes gene_type:complete
MDNFFQNCPPMMADGFRELTDYKMATRRNEYVKYINGIYRDDQYRLFLQQNGDKIMDNVWKYHRKNNSCWNTQCVHNYPTRQLPRQFGQERMDHDQSFPTNVANVEKRPPMTSQCPRYADYRGSKY